MAGWVSNYHAIAILKQQRVDHFDNSCHLPGRCVQVNTVFVSLSQGAFKSSRKFERHIKSTNALNVNKYQYPNPWSFVPSYTR